MTGKIGNLGEELVIKWLSSRFYSILHHSWHCRWGEIDIIARDINSQTLVFVEVKTRRSYNWDSDGLESVSVTKQQKISRSAALFLANNSQYIDYWMRFDVALVRYQKLATTTQFKLSLSDDNFADDTSLNSQDKSLLTTTKSNYQLDLLAYLENAFEAE